MDIIRRNTDYALRLVNLLSRFFYKKTSISAKNLSKQAAVPYPLTCKLLQKLQKAEIVQSAMGPKGGYFLARSPDQISFLEVIEIIQGPICVNRCILGDYKCPLKAKCPLHGKLMQLQEGIIHSLKNTKIMKFVHSTNEKGEENG